MSSDITSIWYSLTLPRMPRTSFLVLGSSGGASRTSLTSTPFSSSFSMAVIAVVFFRPSLDWSQMSSTSKGRGFCNPSFIISWN